MVYIYGTLPEAGSASLHNTVERDVDANFIRWTTVMGEIRLKKGPLDYGWKLTL